MIVVTTPTGTIGKQVLDHLLGGTGAVRVIARDPSKLSERVRDRAEVFKGSHADASVVDEAFDGADAVFWLPPGDMTMEGPEAAYIDFSRAAAAAIERHGIGHVVGLSALGRGWPGEAGHVTATLASDDLFVASGTAYRALACASLMENMLRQVGPIRDQGAFYCPTPGDLALPYVATRDVAATAAALLTDRSWSGADSVALMGPEDLTFDEMALIMTDVLGRPVAFHQISMDDMRSMMLDQGASEGMAQSMVSMLDAKNEGLDHLVPRDAASPTPTTFRTWCEDTLRPSVLG